MYFYTFNKIITVIILIKQIIIINLTDMIYKKFFQQPKSDLVFESLNVKHNFKT